MEFPTQVHRLDNGVRLATVSMPHMESVAVGIWTGAGSRHEADGEHGMAHLLEHMLFKGTPTRNAEELSREIEGLGSSIDGFTVEDHTAYHAKAPADRFDELFEVLADLYRNPIIDPGDLESERQVIREEIAMVRDQPSQLLEDLISETTWGESHPLGRSITGTGESLDSFQRDDVLRFFEKIYGGANTVVTVAGKIDPSHAADIVATQFMSLRAGQSATFDPAPAPAPLHRFEFEVGQEQAHLGIALPGVDRHYPDRFALRLLNVILGENMSSRLFQEIREKRGLCYEVQSELVSFDDAGLVQLYLALGPNHLEEALETISAVFSTILEKGVSEIEVAAARSYLVGQSRVSLENTSSQMLWAGECLLFFDEWRNPVDLHRMIEDTSLDDVNAAARQLLDPLSFSSVLIGPKECNAIFEGWRATTV